MRQDRKNEDRDYLKQFENKSTEELLEIWNKEIESFKSAIKEFLNKDNNNGKD